MSTKKSNWFMFETVSFGIMLSRKDDVMRSTSPKNGSLRNVSNDARPPRRRGASVPVRLMKCEEEEEKKRFCISQSVILYLKSEKKKKEKKKEKKKKQRGERGLSPYGSPLSTRFSNIGADRRARCCRSSSRFSICPPPPPPSSSAAAARTKRLLLLVTTTRETTAAAVEGDDDDGRRRRNNKSLPPSRGPVPVT